MLPDLDSWIDTLEKIYVMRKNRGLGEGPTVIREGVENFMLSEE
jgi:hypothetical protein